MRRCNGMAGATRLLMGMGERGTAIPATPGCTNGKLRLRMSSLTERMTSSRTQQKYFWFLTSVLIFLHLAFILAAGGHKLTFLSGGSDAPAYALLASNLLHHLGYTYSGEPTAFRPPGYPVLLAAMSLLFGRFYVAATRGVQFFVCIATAWICGRSARVLFGTRADRVAFLLALALPTQIFASAQILTECTATFFVAVFFYYLARELKFPASTSEIGMGFAAAVDSYLRFNAAALPLIAGLVVVRYKGRRRWKALAYTMILPLLLISPWLIRNLVAFNGTVLFSTQGGYNALQGILTPQGRTQPGDSTRIHQAVGWVMSELETNNASRLSLPSESVLDKQCIAVASSFWRVEGWHAVPLLSRKVADFWLSADQILDTKSFSFPIRIVRFLGVIVYWIILVMAIAGWRHLHRKWPLAAYVFLGYAAMYTALHLPLVMSTRIRFPLMDPLVAILGGGGWGKPRYDERDQERHGC